MRIPYKVFPDGIGSLVYSAILAVQLSTNEHGAPRTKRLEAIIDSGASRCLFHADFASALGLSLTAGHRERTLGIGGAEDDVYIHEVKLFVPDGAGALTISAGFKAGLPVAGLLGMNGFFENFHVTFDSIAMVCEATRLHRS